ncbi:hypothetical protein ACWD4G_36140 [Streptomyces sp. NPDC002643]
MGGMGGMGGVVRVRGLVVPPLLVELVREGRWRHPGDEVLGRVIPWFEDPLHFCGSLAEMERESRSMDLFADDGPSGIFREVRGSESDGPVELPWLDVEKAFLIAVNRNLGDDVALALDYRTDPADPRVVGSDFWGRSSVECEWRVVAPTFSGFVAAIGLVGDGVVGDGVVEG